MYFSATTVGQENDGKHSFKSTVSSVLIGRRHLNHIMCRRIRQARNGIGKTKIAFKRKTKVIQVSSNYILPYFSYTSFTYVEELISLHVLHLAQGSLTTDATNGDKPEFQKTFQNTNLMHNSFILQQYICYTTLLNMFRAARCSSSGGPIVSTQPLVSSPSVSSRTGCGWRADWQVDGNNDYCQAWH